jgi:two-component system LytT family response regulator
MNKPYRVIIVDDEPPARDLINVFVERIPDLHCVAQCANAQQAIQAIQGLKPDLVFLDIRMPEMSGIDLLNLRLTNRPEIILTTAYQDYALKSYEFAVLDYLMKPIAFERFVQAIVRFRDKMESLAKGEDGLESALTGYVTIPESFIKQTNGIERAVWLREEKRLLQIPYDDVLYIEGMKDYVKVFLTDQMIMTHLSMGKAEELFQPPQFVRIHRSHIVRRSAIRLIDGNTIQLTNRVELQSVLPTGMN